MPTYYSEHNKREYFNAPQFTRMRHRYRGPRESYKINLEIDQLYFSINKLYESNRSFGEAFINKATILTEGGGVDGLLSFHEAWGIGAPDAARSPMFLDVKNWREGDASNKVAWLPGATGNYIEIPDVNLLDTRQASFDNVGFNGTVLPEDRYEIWGSGGGTGAGAPGAASPMLIDLEKLKTDDRHLFLPGKAGNYGSIPDVNLVMAGVDRGLLRGIDGFGQYSSGATIIRPSATDGFDAWTSVTDLGTVRNFRTMVPLGSLVNGQQYTFSSDIRNDGTGTLVVHLDWCDLPATRYDIAPGAVLRVSTTATRTTYDSTYRFGDIYVDPSYVQPFSVRRLQVAAGTNATFVPSTKLVGDLDLRARIAMKDWTPAANAGLISKYVPTVGNRAYVLLLYPTGRLSFTLSNDGTNNAAADSTVSVPAADGEDLTLRVTYRTSDRRVQFFTSTDEGATWTQLGTDVIHPIASIYPAPQPVQFGEYYSTAHLGGKLYSTSIRDGIDGPVVASYNFSNAERGQTALTTPEGHTLTINQNNVQTVGRAEIRGGIPKKAGWLPGTAGNYFSVADINLLDTVQSTFHNTNFTGTVLPADRYEVWGSGGGTGAGAPGAASPMLIDLEKLKTDDRHLFLPGKAGNYGSIPDVNLLEAGNDRGLYRNNNGLRSLNAGSTHVRPGESDGFDAWSTLTVTQGTTWRLYVPLTSLTNGATYTYSAEVRNDGSETINIGVDWCDLVTVNNNSTLAPGATKRFYVTAARSAYDNTFRFGDIYVTPGPSGSASISVRKMMVAPGSNSTFVPSTRIVGDLDLRARSASSWRGVGRTFLSKWSNTAGSSWYLESSYSTVDGELYARFISDTDVSNAFGSGVAVPFSPGQLGWVRFTVDINNGAGSYEGKFYTSTDGITWTQLGTTKTGPAIAALKVASSSIATGARNEGLENFLAQNIYAWELRDGIDGPVVASYDFASAERGQTALTTPEGHVLTIHQSNVIGSGRSEIRGGTPKKAGWLPGAAGNYFSVADTNVLDADTAHVEQSVGTWKARPSTLSRATAYWKATDKVGEYLRDLSGNGHDARFGATGSARVMGPLHGKEGYLQVPGSTGNNATIPDSTDLNPGTDLDIRAKLAPKTWVPTASNERQDIVHKWTGTANSYALLLWSGNVVKGSMRLHIKDSGGTDFVYEASEVTPFANGQEGWVRATVDLDNGAGGSTATFYTSTDGVTWTQLGTSVVIASVLNLGTTNSANVVLGTNSAGNSARLYRVNVKSGISGTDILSVDFTNLADGATSFTEVTGKTVTVNSTSGTDASDPLRLEYIDRKYAYLPGTAGNYLSTPDVNLLDTRQASFDNVSFNGTVTPEDRYEIWGTGGGTAAGTLGAASPFLIDLEKLKTDDRYLFLPGKSGNYGSIPDVNLLTSDQAHMHQNLGTWAKNSYTSSIVHTTADPQFGSGHGRVTAAGTDPYSYIRHEDWTVTRTVPATSGSTWSGSLMVKATQGRRIGLMLGSINSSGTFLGRVRGPEVTATGNWQTLTFTSSLIVDASTAFVVLEAFMGHTDGVTALPAGETWDIDKASLRPGSDATFVPSTRIVGDLDLRARAAADDWTPSAVGHFLGKWSYQASRVSYRFRLNSDGKVVLYWSSDGNRDATSAAISTAAVPAANGEDLWVRVTLDVNNGASGRDINFYTSSDGVTWMQLGTTVTQAGVTSVWPTDRPIELGTVDNGTAERFVGRIYATEVRDGIDGPVIASYNFANAERGQTALTTPEGHALTINQSTVIGSGRAEIRGGIPKKAGWLPGAAGNYFSVADENILNNKQSVFTEIPTATNLLPNETEVWGSGNGTGAGTPGAASPFLIDLESLPDNLSDNPNLWDMSSNAGTITIASDVVDATSPTGRSSRIERTAADAAWAVFRNNYGGSNIVIKKGDEVHVGFWVKRGPNDATDGKLHIMLSTSSATNQITPSSHYFTASTDWQWVDMTFIAKETATPENLVYVSLYSAANIDARLDYYFAGAVVEKVVHRALWLPGLAGNYVSAPDNPANRVRGDIDLRAKVSAKDWTSVYQSLIGKRITGNGAYIFRVTNTGFLELLYSVDGTNLVAMVSTVAIPVADRDVIHLRATLDVDNGASGHDAKFYTSTNGATWTQLGTTVTGTGTLTLYESTAPIHVGFVGGDNPVTGIVLSAQIRDGIDGTIVYDEDFTSARWAGVDKATHSVSLPAKHTTFARASTAYLDATEIAAGTPRYPYGRNRLTKTGALGTSWATYNNTESTQPITRRTVLDGPLSGTTAERLEWSVTNTSTKGLFVSSSNAMISPRWEPNKSYVISWYARAELSSTTDMGIYWNKGPSSQVALSNPLLSTTWQRYSFRITMGATVFEDGPFISIKNAHAATGWLEMGGLQIEESSSTATAPSEWQPGGPSAVLVEQAAANLLTAATADANSGWGANSSGSVVAVSTANKFTGTSSIALSRASAAGTGWADAYYNDTRPTVSAGTTYTLSAWVYANVAPRDARLLISWRDDVGAIATVTGPLVTVQSGRWSRVTLTAQAPTGATNALFVVGFANIPEGETHYFDAVQFEALPFATSWYPGGATRAKDELQIPASVAPTSVGTVELDVYVDSRIKDLGANRYIIASASSAAGPYPDRISIAHDGSNKWAFALYDAAGVGPVMTVDDTLAEGWHRFALAWDAAEARAYIDGTLVVSSTAAGRPTVQNTMHLGRWMDANYGSANSILGAVRISNRARTATELAGGYRFVSDEGTTYLNTFDGDLDGEWGATTTINRSGDATSEIVDRNTWAHVSGDNIVIPDRDILDIGLGNFEVANSAFTRPTTVGRYLFFKRTASSTDPGWGTYIQPNTNNTEINFDSGGGHVHNSGGGTFPTGSWAVLGGSYDRAGDKVGYINGTAATGQLISDHSAVNVNNTASLTIGNGSFRGLHNWSIIFRRILTTAERTELNSWDGSVATEPYWLRAAAVFYTNADDPAVRAAYANNEILNLAVKPTTPFGWNAWKYRGNYYIMQSRTSLSLATPQFGHHFLGGVVGASGDVAYATFLTKPVGPVTAGQTYTASFDFWSNHGGNILESCLVWTDALGAEMGRTATAGYGSGTGNTWRRSSLSGVAPSGAAGVSIYIRTTTANVYYAFDRVTIRQGTATDFVPTHRVVGDFDLRVRASFKDLARTARDGFAGRYGSTDSFALTTNGTNFRIDIRSIAGTGHAAEYAIPVEFHGRSGVHDWRFTFVDATGTFTVYVDGTQVASGAVAGWPGTGIQVGSSPLTFGTFDGSGTPAVGAFLEGEMRDGIDGPIVARFDTDDPAGFAAGVANGASYTDVTTGNAVVLSASGNAKTEVFDRNTWGFTGSETLAMPDRDELDFTATKPYTVAISTKLTGSSGQSPISKMDAATSHRGWDIWLEPNSEFSAHLISTWSTDAQKVIATGAVPLDSFRTLAVTHDGTADAAGMTLYDTSATAKMLTVPNDALLATSDTTNTVPMRIGGRSSGTGVTSLFTGGVSWTAVFRRVLTSAELTTLTAWDGKVATEPSWLRSLAVFYVNADDPLVRLSYENNEVLNLGSAAYGEFGWSLQAITDPDGTLYLDRTNVVTPLVGSMVMRVVSDGNHQREWMLQSEEVGPVTAGQTYSMSSGITTNSSSAQPITPELVWFDNAGGEIGRSRGAVQSTLASSGWSGWTRVTHSAVAPAGAAFVAASFVKSTEAGSGTIGAHMAFDAVAIREGADTGYVHSSRIREDIDIRIKVAPDSWDPSADNMLLSMGGSMSMYQLAIIGSGTGMLQFAGSQDGSTWGILATVAHNIIEGAKHLRVTYSSFDGLVTFYTGDDGVVWTSIGTSTEPTGGPTVIAGDLEVGARSGSFPFSGKVYSSEVRDGINGPVVASVAAADMVEPYVAVTGGAGETWTINRSVSGRKTAVVDRTMLLFGGDDYLEVPDHPDLDYLASDAQTLVVLMRTRDGGNEALISKAPSVGSAAGWGIYTNAMTGRFTHWEGDGSASEYLDADGLQYGTLSALAVVLRTSDTLREAYINGTSVVSELTARRGYSSSHPVRIGATTGGNYADMEFVAAAIFKGEPLTTAELENVATELKMQASGSVSLSTAYSSFGAKSLAVNSADQMASAVTDLYPVSANMSYSIGLNVNLTASQVIAYGVNFYDANKKNLGHHRATDSAASAVRDISTTFTTPAGCAYVEGWVRRSTSYYVGRAVLRAGTDGTFVPSHRITGDLDLRAKVSAKALGTHQYLIAKYGGENAYILNLGSPRLWWTQSDGTIRNLVYSGAMPVGDRDPFWIRATLDVDNGASQHVMTLYTSLDGSTWTQLHQGVGAGVTDIRPAANTLSFGANSQGGASALGVLQATEVRDGIDGPVVARFDADDPSGLPAGAANGTSYTDVTTGHAVVLNASSGTTTGVTTEIVDRHVWGHSGADYLSLPDRAELDMAAGQSFAVALSATVRQPSGRMYLMSKWGWVSGIGDIGWDLFVSSTGQPQFRTLRSPNFPGTGTPSVSWGRHVLVSVRTAAATLQAHVDGAAGTAVSDSNFNADVSNPRHVSLGHHSSAYGSPSTAEWFAVFRRELTTAELTALGSWDGKVATEPVWLRQLAVFYTNADDPIVRLAYETNEVVNLSANVYPYGELGWNVDLLSGSGSPTLLRSTTVAPIIGSHTLKLGMSGGPGRARMRSTLVGAITPGQTYTASISSYYVSAAHWALTTDLIFYDSVGGEIGRTSSTSTPASQLNVWERRSVSGIAPTGATHAAIEVRNDNNMEGSIYFDGGVIRQGSDTGFIPSHRITKDLDLRAKVALKDWTPTESKAVISKEGNYRLVQLANGHLRMDYWSPEPLTFVSAGQSTVPVPVTDREVIHLRATRSAATGDVLYFTSVDGAAWTQLGAVVNTAAGDVNPATIEVRVGIIGTAANMQAGVYQSVEVRDGIDGPVAVRFDADDPAGLPAGAANGASYTDVTTGHAVVLNASGDATTEIVDRMTWMSMGNDWLQMAHRAELDFGPGETFAVAARAFTRSGSSRNVVYKSGNGSHSATAGVAGYLMGNSGANFYTVVRDASTGTGQAVVPVNTGAWYTGTLMRNSKYLRAAVKLGSAATEIRSAATDVNRDLRTTADLMIGSSAGQLGHYGAWQWVAVFRRPLTDAEEASLMSWDGGVATEPVWLRPLSVFYVNADDPLVRASYANNEVLNLGSATYGELGWSVQSTTHTDAAATVSMGRASTPAPVVGSMVVQVNVSQSEGWEAITEEVGPITPGQTYSASLSMCTNLTSTGITPKLIWFDSAHGEIGRTEGIATGLPVGGGGSSYGNWARIVVSGIAPAGAEFVALAVQAAKTWGSWAIDAAIIRQGADTGYVPSLRVREDVDVRFHGALKDWGNARQQTLISKDNEIGNIGFRVESRVTDGYMRFAWSPDGTGTSYREIISTAAPTAVDRSPKWLRWLLDADNGANAVAVTPQESDDGSTWVTVGTVRTVAGASSVFSSTAPLIIGALLRADNYELTGAVLAAQLHDGIGGPVLLDLDIANWPDDSNTYAMPNGLVATIKRGTGQEQSAMIDAPTIAFDNASAGEAHFRISEADALTLSGDFFVYGKTLRYSDGSSPRFIDGGNGYMQPNFWNLQMNGSVQLDKDGSGAVQGFGVSLSQGQWHTIGFERNSGVIQAYGDGVATGAPASISTYLGEGTSYVAVGGPGGSRGVSQGFAEWVAIGHRALTDAERAELAAWDGSVANEPTWLREIATFYWNADDLYARDAYLQYNEVTNLVDIVIPGNDDVAARIDQLIKRLNALEV